MSNDDHPVMIAAIIASSRIEDGEVLALRRWYYGDMLIERADVDALFAINAATGGRNGRFTALFVEIATDFVVYQTRRTGRVAEADAAWLMARMGERPATAAERELLTAVMAEAYEVPPAFAAYAQSHGEDAPHLPALASVA